MVKSALENHCAPGAAEVNLMARQKYGPQAFMPKPGNHSPRSAISCTGRADEVVKGGGVGHPVLPCMVLDPAL